jgi:hypothetical protein
MSLSNMKQLFSLLLLVSFVQGCKDKSTEPLVSSKDPRTYAWTVDTIAYPGSFQTTMFDIWGTSPVNLTVVGHDDQGLGLMWRFDGTKWSNVNLVAAQGGMIDQAIDLAAIFGTAPNAIWAVGLNLDINPHPPPIFAESSFVCTFDGSLWREQRIQRGGPLESISGSDAQNIWTCGSGGTIYHYDGKSWVRDSLPSSIPRDASLGHVVVRNRDEAFLTCMTNPITPALSYYFLTRKNGQWSAADSFSFFPGQVANRFGIYGLWISPQGTLYSFDSSVFRWTGSAWVKVLENSSALRRMSGTSENDFLVVGDFGKALHYNGVDWYEFSPLRNPNAVYSSIWYDGSEAFIVGYLNDGSKTIILHGK